MSGNYGFVKIWLNDKLIAKYQGPVGHNDDERPYFKIGIYRSNSEKTYVIYYKDIKNETYSR